MLANSITFLGVLKTIESFSTSSKILVPSKFIFLSSSKEIGKTSTPHMVSCEKNRLEIFKRNMRSSIKSPKKFKLATKDSRENLLSNVQSSRRL